MSALFGSNIDDVRAEIMRLENAPVYDQRAWANVLMQLSNSPSRRADAVRRMETAKRNQLVIGVDRATGQDKTIVSVSTETGEWIHQDWLHSSEGLPDYEEAERKFHLSSGDIWCGICEDWIAKNELRRWSGDDQLHYLCPGCDADLVEPISLEA